MPKVKVMELTVEQKAALERGAKYDSRPSFRIRCRAILLKSEKRTSVVVAQELGCCEMSVNDWMKRFTEQGIDGLNVAQGRGRKSILQKQSDMEAIRRAVQASRQKISLARVELTKELGKEFCAATLKRFLKKTVASTNECGAG